MYIYSTSAQFYITCLFILFTSFHTTTGDLSDYVKKITNFFNFQRNEETYLVGEDYVPQIPYELPSTDQKFISEAAKLTGVALSELDSCQQRVVFKLKTDCDKMNDEQVAKMGVHLLNCQSYVEGRQIHPCTDDMSIKDCTINMDSDTWTSYHLMSNRAKAVCYSIRQMQFRGMAEYTVNKLMKTSTDQLQILGKIAQNQENLQDMTEYTLDSLSKGQRTLSQGQKDLQQAQFHGQLALEDNINKLYKEKQLILETHNQLVGLTKNIQHRLEDSAKQIEKQTGENRVNHQELLDDIIAIQNKAQIIFQRIEESSDLLIQQNENFKQQYEATLKNLAEVNRTVHNLVNLVGGTRQALEDRLEWLTTILGGTDLAVERLYLILWHSAFMLITMLGCAFLSAPISTRIIVTTIPPLHLALALIDNEKQFGPLGLTAILLGITTVQMIFQFVHANPKIFTPLSLKWKDSFKEKDKFDDNRSNSSGRGSDSEHHYDFSDSHQVEAKITPEFHRELDDQLSDLGSPTPPLSRSGYFNSRSRSRTPLGLNGSVRSPCLAKTRVGAPCKLSSLPGRNYCYRHQSGDSVII